MLLWEERFQIPDGKKAPYQSFEKARYFKLSAEPTKHQILSKLTLEILGYNGITPGPVIIVQQGEMV